jgi:hypothetical protein
MSNTPANTPASAEDPRGKKTAGDIAGETREEDRVDESQGDIAGETREEGRSMNPLAISRGKPA